MISGDRYFAVNTRPGRELEVALRLGAQGFEPFLPVVRKSVRHARKFRTIRAPLFPNYLFVSLDLERHRWRSVNGTIGVIRLVMAGEHPAPVPHGIVESIIAISDETGMVGFENRLKLGQKVKLLSGPFVDLIGQLERIDDNGRVKILLDVMGGKIPLVTHQDQLAPVA